MTARRCPHLPDARRELPATSALEYLREGLQRDRHPATLLIEAPAEAVLEVFAFDDVTVEPLGPDRTRLTVAVDSWHRLLLGLAFLDADFSVATAPEQSEEHTSELQ